MGRGEQEGRHIPFGCHYHLDLLCSYADKDNRLLIFVTPDRNVQREKESLDGIEETVTTLAQQVNPVWFVPTNHGWYWSPTDPFDRTQETNWMSIDNRLVVGGKEQHKRRMCKEDWEVARWLKSTGNHRRLFMRHSYVTCAVKYIIFLNLSINLLCVVMQHFKSLLLAFGRVCDAF